MRPEAEWKKIASALSPVQCPPNVGLSDAISGDYNKQPTMMMMVMVVVMMVMRIMVVMMK